MIPEVTRWTAALALNVISPSNARYRPTTSPAAAKHLTSSAPSAPAANPLQGLSNRAELMEDVVYAGIEHRLTLSETERNEIMSEGWNIAPTESRRRNLDAGLA